MAMSSSSRSKSSLSELAAQRVLSVSAAMTLGGWAVMHLLWDPPYRVLLWSETLMRPVIEGVFGLPWETWVTDGSYESGIQAIVRAIGIGLLLAAWIALRAWRESYRNKIWALLAGSSVLLLLAVLSYKDKSYNPASLVEWGARVLEPAILFGLASGWMNRRRAMVWLRAAIVLTFLGHGLFAIGYFPVPGSFIDMIISTLRVSESQARSILTFAGAMDIVLCVVIFLSLRRFPALVLGAFAYAAVWGLMTALARPISYLAVSWDAPGAFSVEGLGYWVVEAFTRAAHFGIPLAAFFLTLSAAKSLQTSRQTARSSILVRSKDELLQKMPEGTIP